MKYHYWHNTLSLSLFLSHTPAHSLLIPIPTHSQVRPGDTHSPMPSSWYFYSLTKPSLHIALRKGELKDMKQATNRARLTFLIPVRGLLGFRVCRFFGLRIISSNYFLELFFFTTDFWCAVCWYIFLLFEEFLYFYNARNIYLLFEGNLFSLPLFLWFFLFDPIFFLQASLLHQLLLFLERKNPLLYNIINEKQKTNQ